MEFLGLNAPAAGGTSPIARAAENERENVGLAWGLSFICPGAGQLYCGYQWRGITTLVVFWGAVIATFRFKPPAPAWGIALRYAIALWCFATLDAFFTAREINSGVAPMMEGANPRVAAILNLLTKGWGYFYLSKKGQGIGIFFLLLIVEGWARTLHGKPLVAFSVGVEVILAALCAHAYYLGRQQLREALASSQIATPAEGLSVGLPLTFAIFVSSVYVSLIVLGLMLPDYKAIDQSRASVNEQNGKAIYANPKYGVRLEFPQGWKLSYPGKDQFVMGVRPGGGCVVQFMAAAQFPIVPISANERELSKVMSAKGHIFDGERDAALGQMAAREVTFRHQRDEGEIDQSFTIAKKGLSVYFLITTSSSDVRSKCEATAENVKSSVRLR